MKDRRMKNEAKETLHDEEFVNEKIVNPSDYGAMPAWDERAASLALFIALSNNNSPGIH